MRFPFRTGLRGRYLAGILALLVFVGAVIIVLIQTTVRDRLEKELQKRGVSIAKHFAEVSANPFLTDTIVSIEFLANDYMASEEDLAYIFALDRYGKVVAHTFDKGFPQELTGVNPLAPGQSYNIRTIRTEQGNIFDIAAPILKGDMGVVHIGISQASINRGINDVLGRTSWFILAVLFLGGIYSIFFTSAITRPVRELIKGVEAVGSGDLGQRISFTNRDEIGELSGAFNRMGENLKQITVSKEYMDRLVNTMNDALLVLEDDGSIRSVNRAFCQLLGYAQEELVGQPAEMVVPADVMAADRQTLTSTPEIVGGRERTLLDRDGRQIPVISSMAGMYDEGGRLQAVIFTAQDISVLKHTQSMLQEKQLSLEKLNQDLEHLVERRTDTLARTNAELIDEITARKETERELTKAKEAAEVASIAKTEFLANMSHEIRTPLNVIIGTAEFLQETATSTEQQDSLTMLQRSSAVLLQLLNDILDLTRIESGKLEMESIPFDATELMETTCAMLRMQADGKGLELSFRVNCSAPPHLLGDPYRLRQVLVNLIGNAIKFTEKGSVLVSLEKCSPVPDGFACTFSVKDTGIGIPDDKLQNIFELFTQADASTTRRYGGSGLGLAICQRLVALMGGECRVESQVGVGSTFFFTVRMASQQSMPMPTAAHGDTLQGVGLPPPSLPPTRSEAGGSGPAALSSKKRRVLLVDDSTDNRLLIAVLMKNSCYDFDGAENGAAAVEMFRQREYDAVLMDLSMPVLDGYDATRMMRQMERELARRHTPIIALTAHSFEEEKQKARDAGCDYHLAKPFKKVKLLECLETFTGGNVT